MIAVVILNWNGAPDTIACLDSLRKMPFRDYFWMVVDNGSNDDSPARISRYLQESGQAFFSVREEDSVSAVAGWKPGEGVLLRLKENYGFAKGNNKGIAFFENCMARGGILQEGVSHYLLLNNDTEAEPDFLSRLDAFARTHPEYAALTPQIRYGNPRSRVWNCGGRMFFGFRKYLYGEKDCSTIREREYLEINLITGCALFAKRELIGNPDAWRKEGGKETEPKLLTERFFFGEEDFDFSLRMQEEGRKMACVLDSVIYHKHGSTQNGLAKTGRIYVHYLNRFIDVRQHWRGGMKFFFWKSAYVPYVVLVFRKYGNSWKRSWGFARKICRESRVLEGVDRNKFRSCLEIGAC